MKRQNGIGFYDQRVPAVASEPNFFLPDAPAKPEVALTTRELDVLHLLGNGCTSKQAALRLGVSPHTVVTHIRNAYRKLEAHTAAGAVVRAIHLGLLDLATLFGKRS